MEGTRNEEERRTNRLHADDLSAIIHGVSTAVNNHACRFHSITQDDLQNVVDFVKAIMDTTKTTKKLIWKILVSTVVISLLGWTAIGMMSKLKDYVIGILK